MSVNAGAFTLFGNLFSNTSATTSTSSEEVAVDYSAKGTPLLSAHLNPDPLAVGGGDVVVDDGALVAAGPVPPDVIAATHQNNGEISVYVVREGDSLSQIAEMYGVTTNTIIWANDLKSPSDIHPGQSLVILPIAGIRHTVKKGETLASIAKKYDANLNDIIEYNNLASASAITVGQTLMLPGAEMATVVVTPKARPTKSTGPSSLAKTTNEPAHNVTPYSNASSVGDGSWLTNPNPGAICTQGIHGYNGVDLATSYGSPIHAAASGRVIVSRPTGYNGGYGHYIVIKHSNGVQTLYAHLSGNSVSVGDWVTQGQVIGHEGSTGRSTGPHLHFEVRGGYNPFAVHCES